MVPCDLLVWSDICQQNIMLYGNNPRRYFATGKSGPLKRMNLNSTRSFAQSSERMIEDSYELSLLVATTKKGHIVGEIPWLILFSDQRVNKNYLKFRFLATLKRRIDDMVEDIKNLAVDTVIQSPFCATQLDENTDVQCSQLLVFVRYIKDETKKDEILFSTELTTAKKVVDIISAVSEFFVQLELTW
ncbi:hypothetical protein PR048_012975 [Dryococelus australis]|uniref:Uncharacterized protein n=1 Tax=Dryococelus australis TaxID=614101 RepID=A0ABQ9HSB9_9NEOP|nr:hypothetical protein PR048_012975 [Dryococelus australis]